MAKNEKIGAKSDGKVSANENIVTKTVTFFNKYQKIIYGVLIAILIVIFAIVAINRFYLKPKKERGSALILKPIEQYTRGIQTGDTTAYIIALEGDEENDGFLSLISGYKMTGIANSSRYFAGLCYLQLGDLDEALNYLLKFKNKDEVYWYACQMVIGDIYDQQEDDTQAIKYYKKAVKGDNPYYTPVALFKLGQMQEKAGNWREALDSYQKIENSYYDQYLVMGVDRYLERAKIKAQ